MTRRPIEVHESSGNVFADLGLPDAGTHFLKAQIAAELHRLTTERKLDPTKAGILMGISQPEVSRLFTGVFREYSVERLMGFLTTFGQDVEIVSRPRRPNGGMAAVRGTIAFKTRSAP
jgi:predicted XRE-type DNA-binding protein